MNILLIGEDAAGMQTLHALRHSDHRIVAVMAQAARPGVAGGSLWRLATNLGYPVWPAKLVKDPHFADQIRGHAIDLILNVHSLFVICPEVLEAPRLGAYNLHPGPLPRYGGLNSVCWAIYHGEQTHGVTLHRMVPKLDAGPIVYQETVEIGSDETGLSLTTKCVDVGVPLVLQMLDAAAEDPSGIPSVPQDLSAREYFSGRAPDDGRMSWHLPAKRVYDFVRACDFLPFSSPWGPPRTMRGQREIGIVKVRLTGILANAPPGSVGEKSDSGVEVACGDEWILVQEVLVDGKLLPAADVLVPGDPLETVPAPAVIGESHSMLEKAQPGIEKLRLSGTAIPRRTEGQPVPLSYQQEQAWLQAQMAPDLPLNNEPVTLLYTGPLDTTTLERSLNEILRRHEVFRTSIVVVDGKPLQLVQPSVTLALPPVVDLRNLPHDEREARALCIADADARKPLDLTQAPGFSAKLFRLEDQQFRLSLILSQVLFDRVSISDIFIPELAALYREYSLGTPSGLFEPRAQYADYACWQRRPELAEGLVDQIAYWQRQVSGQPSALTWPNDRARPPVQTYRGETQSVLFPPDLVQKLKALSGRESVTLFVALISGFAAVLHRYTGEDVLFLGTTTPGRIRPELRGISGCFRDFLPIRVDLSGNPTFQQLLARVKIAVDEARANSDVPLGMLVERLKLTADPSRHPIFQIAITLQSQLPPVTPDWIASYFDVSTGASRFDLSIDIQENLGGLAGPVTYKSDLFERDTVTRAMRHWRTLLEGALVDPTRQLSELPLLEQDERRLMVENWNATSQPYPTTTVHGLVAAQVEKTPEAVAFEMGSQRLTFNELNLRANRLARHLRKLGVGPDSLVGLFMERSAEMVVGLLGILKAGGAYIPLDPAFPTQRLEFMLSDASPQVVVTQESLRQALPRVDATLVVLDTDFAAIDQEASENLDEKARPENLAYVLYTSGSTGKPKGVQIEHRCMVNFLTSMQREPGLRATDALVAVTTLSFDIAGLEIFLPLITGARIVMASAEEVRDGTQLKNLLRRSGVTLMQATPATWRLLIDAGWTGKPELKILCGGEAMPPELARELCRRSRSVWNLYGPTETTVWSTHFRVAEPAAGQVPIGRPIANTQIYLLDANLNPVPVGATGELYIGGDGVARGYLNRPELTAEKFVADPFRSQPGARLYRTGDLARYRPDGNVDFLGRSDNQVKIRGFRIELGEIESTLAQHPGINAAVTIIREDTPGDTRLVAYVIPRDGLTPSFDDLRNFLGDKLPKYMVPGNIVFLDRFPLTPNGKVDRRALPVPDSDRTQSEEFVAPRNEIETKLVRIWEDILGVHPISVRTSFFDLGGHSLLVTRLLIQIERTFGEKLSVATVFEAETVEQLAALLGQEELPDSPAVIAIQKSGSATPFFCLGAGPMFRGLARRFGPDQPFLGVRIEPHELTQLGPPHTFEEIAAVFTRKIRAHQPQGPYCIGGFCLTGVVAFEVARQLIAQGDEVKLLIVFYGNTPAYFARSSKVAKLQLRIYTALHHLRNLSKLRGKEFRLYAGNRLQGLIEKIKPAPTVTDNVSAPLPELEHVGSAAAQAYRPTPAPIRTVVFRPVEDPQGRFWDIQGDWSKFITGELHMHPTPGDHSSMFKEPNVDVLADRIKSYLTSGHSAQTVECHESELVE